jgi:hypothetical protein
VTPLEKDDYLRLILLTITLVLATQVTSVKADTQQLFNSTVNVKNLNYYTITQPIDISGMTNVELQVEISVVSGGTISAYVMDAAGYQQFQQSTQPPESALYRADDIVSQTLSAPIAKSGNYYVVLDNEKSLLTSKTVKVQLSLSFEIPFTSSTQFYVIVVVVVLVVAALIFIFVRRKRRVPTRAPPAIRNLMMTEVGFKKCVFCGALMHELAKTCPACGKQQS